MKNLGWALLVRSTRSLRRWDRTRLCQEAGIDRSYIVLIERDGYVPRAQKVVALADALGIKRSTALAAAGYAPVELGPDDWEAILTDLRAQDRLCPELRAALRGLQGLSGDQLREADAMLLGLARGFALAREQRAAARRKAS